MSTQTDFASLVKKTHINLSFNSLHDANIDVLVEVLQKSTVLKELNLWSNQIMLSDEIGTQFTDALATSKTIRVLSLGSNQIGAEGGKKLAAALKANTSLEEIHLGDNQIGDDGAVGFAEALTVNTTLRKLGLYGNGIGDAGASSLATAFESNTSLRVVWLHENRIGDAGGEKLAEALESNKEIGSLFFFGNSIGASVAGRISKLLQDAGRKTADLDTPTTNNNNNNIMAQKMTVDVNVAAEGGEKKDDVDVMSQINLWGNHISGVVGENFKAILTPRNQGAKVVVPTVAATPTAAAAAAQAQETQASANEEGQITAKGEAADISTASPSSPPNAKSSTTEEDEIKLLKAALRAKEEELKAKDDEIDVLKKEGCSSAKDGVIVSLKAELASRDEAIESTARKLIPSALAAKDAKIAALNSCIEREQKSFDESNAQKLQEIATRDVEIASLKEEIAKQSKAVEQMDEVLATKDAEIESKVAEAAGKDEAIASLDEVISQNGQTIAQMEEDSAIKDGEIASKDAELALKGEEIVSRDAEIATLAQELVLKDEQIVELKAAQQSPLKQLQMFIAGKDEKISTLEAALAKNVSSKSTMDADVNADVDPAVEELTGDETVPNCDTTKPVVIAESDVVDEQQQPTEDPVFEDARDDAASNRLVELE